MPRDKNQGPSLEATELRRRAEERLKTETPAVPRTEADMQRLLHELQVHQIELEMQNTELRQARDETEKALEMYADLYDFAPVGYLTLDRDGSIRAANLTVAGLLGREHSQLIGRRFGLFVAAEIRPTFLAFLGRVFASPAKESCEVALVAEGDSPRFVQIEALACTTGQECRVALIDISKRRQLEEQIEMQHAELLAANIELEAFNYTISHDLRAPLTIIQGYSQILRELPGDQLQEPARDYLREIHEGALRMNRLIDTLLEFSCVARVEIRTEKLDLSKMAEDVATELKMKKRERRVTFRIAAGIVANGDPDLLRVVLVNLLGNAWKYSGQREPSVIEFGLREVDGKPACYVRDNGPGFDLAHADKLFIPFQRLPGTKAEGHGIGLATVDRIVRRHGGLVWAESQPGKGTTFYFTLK
jgi:signal transduction histidine kinase